MATEVSLTMPRNLRGIDGAKTMRELTDDEKRRSGLLPALQEVSLDDRLRDAAEAGDAPLIRKLVEEGADVNCIDVLSKTPMHFAAINAHVEALRTLKELGGDPNARAMGHKSPLDWACKPGSRNKENNATTMALLQGWAAGSA